MTPITVTLPWPARALSPNVRAHWGTKHKKGQAAKNWAITMTQQAMRDEGVSKWPAAGRTWAKVDVCFQPPPMRRGGVRRDQDNLIASMKSAFDGIAQAIGIDDSRWRLGTIEITAPRRPGCVTVTIEPVEAT